MKLKTRTDFRRRRHRRVRRKISGSGDCPRMAVMISNQHMYVQFVDDETEKTIVSVSTLSGDLRKNLDGAAKLGERAGQAAREKGIRRICVDRGGYRYHGRVKAIVEAVEKAGISVKKSAEKQKKADSEENGSDLAERSSEHAGA